MPGKNHTFTTRVDPVSPPQIMAEEAKTQKNWWRRRALPPGPLRLFRTAFIAIVDYSTSLIYVRG
jgi:hypothetical protein